MSRKKGTAVFAVNFEPSGQMPLDARLLVADMNELIASETYASNNYYIGMPVIVIEGKSGKTELWVLKDTTKINKEEGWQRLDADEAAINQSIKDAINNLDATVGGTTIADGKHVTVQVVQENGELKTLTVTENDIASKTALDNEVTRATAAEKANANAIAAMDLTDTAVDGEFITTVSQSDGKVTIARGKVASDKVTAVAVAAGTDTVAIDGVTAAAQIKSLGKTIKTVQDNAAKYEVEKVTTNLPTNVEARYQVVSYVGTKTDANKTKVGEFIDIPKDGQLQNVEVTNNAYGEPTVIKFTYVLDGGEIKNVSVDLGKAIFESEMGDGIVVADNKIAIKLADGNETFLTVNADGLKLTGVQNAIDTSVTTEKNRAVAAEDKIESSVGLAADGSFTVPTNKKYINGATSVMNAVEKLDAKLFEVVDDGVIDCGVYAADPTPSE